jgi:hypothetical protein
MIEEFWDGRKEFLAQLSVEDPPGLVRGKRRMLVFDPAKRASAQYRTSLAETAQGVVQRIFKAAATACLKFRYTFSQLVVQQNLEPEVQAQILL